MGKVIIAIHGLGNHPRKKLLEKWWKKSLMEGLKNLGHSFRFVNFEFVYWADILHPDSLDPSITDPQHPLFLAEPYIPATEFPTAKPHKLRQNLLSYVNNQLDKIFLKDDLTIHFESVTDRIIQKYFKDFDIYFSDKLPDNQPAKTVIQNRLVKVLKKHRHKKILLLSHSMGTVIAYDVLTNVTPHINIDTLITIGSPLGIPVVISKIASEQKKELQTINDIHTPENVIKHWYNFSDLEDKIAIDFELAGDYRENSKGIQVQDFLIENNYFINGKRNPHKAYGYLRAPEFSKVIYEFLKSENVLQKWFMNKIKGRTHES